jgi:DNA relaxase NicK
VRFDWYAATVKAQPRELLAGLCDAYGPGASVEPSRPLHGYERGCEIAAGGMVRARVLYGGRNGDPHAWACGEDTDAFVHVVRSRWGAGQHVVTRCDAAEDFDAPGAFDALGSMALAIADERGLKVHHNGDWHRGVEGRTIYVGSRKSSVFVRLYEKGKQLRSQLNYPGQGISRDWVRLEAQVRPEKEARAYAASMAPVEAWGLAAWTRELCAVACGSVVPRVRMHVWREADDERAFRFMCRQYGPMLARLRGELGDWACVGKTIGETVEGGKDGAGR